MNTKQFRALCEQIFVPMLAAVIEPRLIDIHDILDISANEIARLGDRLDDIDAQLRSNEDNAE